VSLSSFSNLSSPLSCRLFSIHIVWSMYSRIEWCNVRLDIRGQFETGKKVNSCWRPY
jgi:hypothetical protein